MLITRKYTFGDGTVKYVEEEVEEQITYTTDQLNGMTSAELEAICAELGIFPNKSKANMIVLIMDKQKGELT